MTELRNLRISFIAGTLAQGGAERQLYYILGALVRAGADIRVLCLTSGEFWEERITALGIPVIHVGQRESRFARLMRIAGEVRRHRPMIVQSQHFYTNPYAALAARMTGGCEIGAIRNDVISEIAANGRVLGPLCLRLPRRLAANSRAAIETALRLGARPRKILLLPNVIDTDHFSPSESAERDRIRIVTAGRLVEQKRIDRFLRIVAAVRARTARPVEVEIFGRGPLLDDLRSLARDLGLPDDVLRFTDVVADARKIYRDADIFMLTSDFEGTPNVVLEAMSSGLPVIATSVGGTVELIEDGESGFLSGADEIEKMISACIELIESPDLRSKVGARARARVVSRYSLDALPGILSEFYAELP